MIRLFLLILVTMTFEIFAMENDLTFMGAIPHDFKTPGAENDYDKKLLSDIDEIGWRNIHISEEGDEPAFAFTIGHFYKHNHPELIVIGLPIKTSHKLLNIAVVKIVGANEKIEPYRKYESFTEDLSVAFIPVELKHYGEYLGYANWFYEDMDKPYPALQMVWPDKEGRFPWDEGYDKRFLQIQPLLGQIP